MTLDQVDGIARGRVWTGVRGTEVGIVDAYGGLREAVMRARAIAGLRIDRGPVQLYPDPPGLLQNLRAMFSFELPVPLAEDGRDRGGFGGASTASAGVLAYLPRPLLAVLARLPVALWLSDGPEALAMDERTWIIE
jgi:protease-4